MKKCGNILKIFYFDIKIAINILIAKAKYIMIQFYKKYSDINVIYYDKYENNYLEHSSLFKNLELEEN